MTTGQVHTWFPKPIYFADNLLTDKLLSYENRLKSIMSTIDISRTDMLNVDSTWGKFHIQDDLVFADLVNTIYNRVAEFAELLGYDKDFISKFKIGNMWGNISKEGDFLYPHVHPGSLFSGAFYIKTYEGSKITFYDDIGNILPEPKNSNALNFRHCSYECLPGRLMIFPSNILHSTPKQIEGEKIVISFNMRD